VRFKFNFKANKLKIIFIGGLLFYTLCMVLLFKAEQQDPENGNIHSFGEAVWYSIVTVTTVGYGDYYPVTPLGHFFGILLVLGSLGVTGYIIGNVSSSINNYMEKKKLGLFGSNFTDHIIIFGYDEFANQVIDQIIETEHAVAIVTNRKDDIDLINDHYGDNDQVFAMFMDYTHMESLEKVNVKECKTIFVNFEDDTETLVYFLNIKAYCPDKDIVVTIYNSSLKSTFINAGVTYIVCKNELSSKLVASFIFEPDVAKLTEDIMATASQDFHYDITEMVVKKTNPFHGKNCDYTFDKLKKEFNVILLGISKLKNNVWTLTKNPGADITVNDGDYLIMMANGGSKRMLEVSFDTSEGKLSQTKKT